MDIVRSLLEAPIMNNEYLRGVAASDSEVPMIIFRLGSGNTFSCVETRMSCCVRDSAVSSQTLSNHMQPNPARVAATLRKLVRFASRLSGSK